MKLKKIYELAVDRGIEADPRGRKTVAKDIDKANALLTKEYRKPYTLAYTG